MLKEKIKDVGRRIIGQGPEVDFKNRVNEYATLNGVAPEEAQKAILGADMQSVQDEIGLEGALDRESKTFRQFQAALNEIFTQMEQQQFKIDSSTSAFTPLPVSATKANRPELNRSANYYRKKFDGKIPPVPVVRDTAELTKTINALFDRFGSSSAIGGTGDLNSIMVANPELGADLGKLLLLKQQLEQHEKMFSKGCNFEKSMQDLKNNSRELITKGIWQDTYDWLRVAPKALCHPNLSGFMTAFNATSKFFLKTAWRGSKLLGHVAKTTADYIRK